MFIPLLFYINENIKKIYAPIEILNKSIKYVNKYYPDAKILKYY